MKRILKFALLLGLLMADFAMAFPDIDRTCKNCERRYLDSLNVYNRRPIRVNQAGFRPQDHKYAYVADPSEKTFKVIDANTLQEVDCGNKTLTSLGLAPKPNIWVNGAFKSIGDPLYEFGDSVATNATEQLYKADFSGLTAIGEYFVVVGKDTSATFYVDPAIYNAIFENSLKFFGIQRCGDTHSQLHGMCHMKDGSEIGFDLTGGWHDCGDHFKVVETLGYTAYALATTYLVYQDKAEDRFGNSYDDTVFTDGIPDILYEAKIGADYIYKLYKASKAKGLIDQHDMYHSIAVGSEDHQFWDVPEKQDAQPQSKGGPDRHVAKGIGTAAGMYAASLAYFAVGWRVYDPDYADSLLAAAEDIYKNVMLYYTPATGGDYTGTSELGGFYPGGTSETNMIDDAAAAALALWYATKDTSYQYDLYKNMKINDNSTNYGYNNEPDDAGPYFKGGFLGLRSGFTPGGWVTDFENVHSYLLFLFVKLILKDVETAKEYNVDELERDTLVQRATNCLRRLTDDGSQGSNLVYENRFGKVTSDGPYNLVWTSSAWGFNRYNLGAANAIFMLSEITSGAEKEAYKNLALDNIYYNLGANPWDISFLMGAGDKNLNHPHNRAANPDGYNAGGMPYKYKCPRGALMGAAAPTAALLEDWSDYTATETCIDFSVQLLMPAQSLAETLPPDNDGPLFSNIAGTPITETTAVVSWDADEVALVTVFYNTSPDPSGAKSVQQKLASKGGSVTLEGLEMNKTYYFFLEGMDTKRNLTTDDNHGMWYQFTMTPSTTTISGVTICQVDHRSAKIYWWSGDRLNGLVKYGTSSSESALTESQSAEGGAVLFHEATLTNLKAGTTYYFSVSSGATTDDNEGNFYSFTTESHAVYADFDIWVKPTAYQNTSKCTANDWKNCGDFIIEIDNNDTTDFEDFELRFYLGAQPSLETPVSYIGQVFDGTGLVVAMPQIQFGQQTQDETGAYYLPINVKSKLYVSGRIIFQVKWLTATFADFNDGWSLIPHLDEDDPEQFVGIDLTQAPYFTQNETEQIDKNSKGETVIAFTRDPYIPVYYHGKHIYGYGADYTPENGPVVFRKVALDFETPFKAPHYSLEQEDYPARYSGRSSVSPSGILDEFEMNGQSYFDSTKYEKANRKDAFLFSVDTILAYGNNYMEWVSWHNRFANSSEQNKYDCACAVVRSNVEVDSITIPPEIRILKFSMNTIRVYTGKMVEVHVYLLDSTGALLETDPVPVLLSSESGLAKFYTSATSTIPTEKIDIIKCEAVFYVSSDKATTTILKAVGSNSSKVNYIPAMAELIIEDLPPWPIIDIAKMVDTNCDNVPDAIRISLSNEYQENQSFNSIKFVYNGDTIVSSDVIKNDGKELLVKANIKDSTINTVPSGSITLISNVSGKTESHTDFYQDGMSPALLAVSVLERLDTATSDRVYLQFSEPITSPGTEWPVQLYNGSSKVSAPTVISSRLYNEAMNVWELEVGFAADGSSIVNAGMFAQLVASGAIKDKNGNLASTDCGQPKLPITLKILPVPMTYAAISDNDEDGIAERVYIEYARKIDESHYPDSISLVFGLANPETLWVKGSEPAYADDGMSAVLTLPQPFSYGVTRGNYEGFLKGVEVTGAGLVSQHLGSGASYERDSVLAEDEVGPVIVTAAIDMSKSDKYDVLNMVLSEPVNVVDSSRVYYHEKISDLDTAIYKYSVQSVSFNATKTEILAIYDKESPLAVNDGDYVRLYKEYSALSDVSGNMPSLNAQWVPIMSDGDPTVKYVVTLRDVVSRSGGMFRSQVPSADNIRMYVLNPVTRKLDLISNGQIVATGIDTTAIQGSVWKIELSLPSGRASVNSDAPAWDSLRVKYNVPIYSNLGSYVNRLYGSFSVSSSVYYSMGKVIFYAEWANTDKGIVSEQGKAVATGAYIYKMQMDALFIPNPNADVGLAAKYSGKHSYDKTATFGIKREK